MTNILQLPQLEQMSFAIVTNADFRDAFVFLEDATVDPPIAIDITGIAFRSTVRSADAPDDEILFHASTSDGTFELDGEHGLLAFAVPRSALRNLEAGTAYGDLIAEADGKTINLCKDAGPLEFVIRRGLT